MNKYMKLSNKFKIALKLSEEREYKLAYKFNINYSQLSLAMNDARNITKDDRYVQLGKYLGLNENEIYDETN